MKLSEVLPNQAAALEEYTRVVRAGHKIWNTQDVKSDLAPALDTPLTNEETSRLRFGRSWLPQGRFAKFGARWGRGLSLAFAIIPKDIQPKVLDVLEKLSIFKMRSVKGLQSQLKEMTGLAKKHGDILFSGYWKWLVNWENLGGYMPTPDIDTFVDELRLWATGDIVHEIPKDGKLSEDAFLDAFEEGMADFLNGAPNITKANEEAPTIDEFVSSPGTWARAGASSSKSRVWYSTEDGKKFKTKRSKWSAALATHPSRVKAILMETRPALLRQHNKAIEKREPGKVRAVVNSNDELYLRMAYVSEWLETALRGHPNSTLFMSTQQLVSLWEDLSRATEDQTVKMPLDQSHFDWQANKRMISRFIRVVRRMVVTHCPMRIREDMLLVLRGIEVGLVEIEGTLEVGTGPTKVTLPVQKGIMSGWRWTALMDTVFNWGELFVARRLVRQSGFTEPVIAANAQGDDDQIRCPTYGHAAAIAESYNIMNFEVNPSKFFVDANRDEYLRQVPVPGEVSGYPIRGITAILWRNPISKDPPAGLLRMQEQVKLWNVLLGRGADYDVVIKNMVIDLTQGNGISKDEVSNLLCTPASLGGIGFWNRPSRWMSSTPGIVTSKGRVDPSSLPGLAYELADWHRRGVELSAEEVAKAVVPNLELTKAGKEVVAGSIKEVTVISPMPWRPSVSHTGIPLGARGRDDLPITLSSFVLERAVRQKDWAWIRDSWLDPDLRNLSDRIESRGGRRVWIDWLLSKLPWNLPVIPRWGDLKATTLYKGLCQSAWARVVGMTSFSSLTVKRAALSCEYGLREMLLKAPIRLGG